MQWMRISFIISNGLARALFNHHLTSPTHPLSHSTLTKTTVSVRESYETMRDALNATGRPILFSLCSWGSGAPHEWGQKVGRTGGTRCGGRCQGGHEGHVRASQVSGEIIMSACKFRVCESVQRIVFRSSGCLSDEMLS